MFNYENDLELKLKTINTQKQLGLTIEVASEQAFAKQKTFAPNTIYVVVKKLGASMTFEAITQPVQLIIICEQNSLDKTQELLNTFVETYNWQSETQISGSTTTYVKQQYSKPVVMSNFNEVGFGYRSALYVSGTLFLMENVLDVKDIYVDGVEIQPLTFNINYSMSGNTQPVRNDKISSTEKNVSTMSISMSIPMTDTDLVRKIIGIMNVNDTNWNGNEVFAFSFNMGLTLTYNMKLTSAQVITSPNQVPSLSLGFMR